MYYGTTHLYKVLYTLSLSREIMKPKERMKICHSCEYLKRGFIKPSECEVCGCIIRLKVRIPSEKCPMDKWD